MDIRSYFRKLGEVEADLAASVVLVSNATPDGGVAGRVIEVSRTVAARMIVSGAARLATDIEAREYRDEIAREIEQAIAELEASRVRLMVTTDKLERMARPAHKPKV
jgi:hypothetical protein